MKYRAGKHIYTDKGRRAHGYIAGQTGRQIQCSAGWYIDTVLGIQYIYSRGQVGRYISVRAGRQIDTVKVCSHVYTVQGRIGDIYSAGHTGI